MILAALGLLMQVGGEPAILMRARVDTRAEVSFHAIAYPETVYVGGAVTYELGVFIADEMRQRLRRNPEFVPPELRSVLAYDLPERGGARTVVREGRTYEVHVFRRALFPVAPGRINIPPARLTYAVPLGPSFFSREETRSLQSERVSIMAISPPEAGRPSSWNGAVGDLALRATVATRRPRVGDPAVVTLRVSGSGNVHLWPRPVLALPWATVVEGTERVVVDSTSSRVRGAKEFDYLVTPSAEGRVVVPPVSYAYFDPASRSYRTARSRAESLTVATGELVALDTAVAVTPGLPANVLARKWSGSPMDAPDRYWPYWLLLLLVPVPALVRAWRRRPRTNAVVAQSESLDVIALHRGASTAEVQHALRLAVEARLGGVLLPWADLPALRRDLRHRGVTDATADRAITLFARLNAVTYGGADDAAPDAAEHARAIYAAIDNEAQRMRRGRRRRVRAPVSAVVFIAFASAALAQNVENARSAFARGIVAYDAGDAYTAADEFFEAARQSPWSPSAWANAGAASWVAADTARAVVAWQRALRLSPLDGGVRDQLARVGADAGSDRSAVWPLPRRALAWIALVLWAAAWVDAWRRRVSRRTYALAFAGATLAAVSYAHGRRLSDPALAVIVASTSLRMLPAMGAEAGPAPLTGEIVHVLERAGVWARISADNGRDGWIDAARLLDLNGNRLRD